MIFQIRFSPQATTVHSKLIMGGINLLDKAREHLPNVDPGLVDGISSGYTGLSSIELTEYQARQSGRFATTNEVYIDMETYWLENLCRSVPFITRRKGDDKIVSVGWIWVVDQQAIISAWIQAGAPLRWRQSEGHDKPFKLFNEAELRDIFAPKVSYLND